jgi:hypothetical protein
VKSEDLFLFFRRTDARTRPLPPKKKEENGKEKLFLLLRRRKKMVRENTNQKAPDVFSRLQVFEKAAAKKDDHNHPNSLQRVNYRNEIMKISGNQQNIF